MMGDQGFSSRHRYHTLLVDGNDGVDLIWKNGTVLPATVDPMFDVKFDEGTHDAYLCGHLKTAHMP